MPTGNIVADDYIDDPDRTVPEMQVAMNGLFDYVRSLKAEFASFRRQELGEAAVFAPAELVPPGVICMWSGSSVSIPEGWALCDGENGTPDMRGRFVVGAGGSYDPGDTGGANSVQLTEAQMPSHSHSGSTNTTGSHSHSITRVTGSVSSGNYSLSGSAGALSYSGSAGNHSHSITTNTKGGNQSHENRPPYYALAYIMRLTWSAT